jgi:hypothetical protein
VLTCKSLFGLGYRGERLIEPSAVVVDRSVSGAGVGVFCALPASAPPSPGAAEGVCVSTHTHPLWLSPGDTVKLPEPFSMYTVLCRNSRPTLLLTLQFFWGGRVPPGRAERARRHRRESGGHGNKPTDGGRPRERTHLKRRSAAKSGRVATQPTLWMQFRDWMAVGRGVCDCTHRGLRYSPSRPTRALCACRNRREDAASCKARCRELVGALGTSSFRLCGVHPSFVSWLFFSLSYLSFFHAHGATHAQTTQRLFASFAVLHGSVAQMVERSLRMRQVQGSMPCTSIPKPRTRRRWVFACRVEEREGGERRGYDTDGEMVFTRRRKRRSSPERLPGWLGSHASSWFPPKFPPG